MTYTCLKDPTHVSDDPDYCSICGAKIAAPAVTAPSSPPPSSGDAGTACPDCGTPRTGGARFCEVCRHDFGTGAAGSAAPARRDLSSAPPLSPPSPPTGPPDANIGTGGQRLEVVAVVDPSLYEDPDPSMVLPADEPPRTFPLDLAENLIGRRSDKRDIHPEVPLSDPGVSHRHAKLLREPDGSFVLLDVGSSNGTQLNGREIPAGVRTPVGAGDEITLGCWTRITLRERGAQP